ncbi:hypothetical protein BDR07DRAFT_1404100 [Suillus spraguei]|nr:hypothetical protein BDR07DRAFT_1404100 [Suillus spraguei]
MWRYIRRKVELHACHDVPEVSSRARTRQRVRKLRVLRCLDDWTGECCLSCQLVESKSP